MRIDGLSREDWAFIQESLRTTRRTFADYGGYPSYEFKQQRLADCDAVMAKVATATKRKGNG